jgi:hypothetical protein
MMSGALPHRNIPAPQSTQAKGLLPTVEGNQLRQFSALRLALAVVILSTVPAYTELQVSATRDQFWPTRRTQRSTLAASRIDLTLSLLRVNESSHQLECAVKKICIRSDKKFERMHYWVRFASLRHIRRRILSNSAERTSGSNAHGF